LSNERAPERGPRPDVDRRFAGSHRADEDDVTRRRVVSHALRRCFSLEKNVLSACARKLR